VLAASSLGFNALFFWMHRLRWRVLRLEARHSSELTAGPGEVS
jgi:hypothetical protein